MKVRIIVNVDEKNELLSKEVDIDELAMMWRADHKGLPFSDYLKAKGIL